MRKFLDNAHKIAELQQSLLNKNHESVTLVTEMLSEQRLAFEVQQTEERLSKKSSISDYKAYRDEQISDLTRRSVKQLHLKRSIFLIVLDSPL